MFIEKRRLHFCSCYLYWFDALTECLKSTAWKCAPLIACWGRSLFEEASCRFVHVTFQYMWHTWKRAWPSSSCLAWHYKNMTMKSCQKRHFTEVERFVGYFTLYMWTNLCIRNKLFSSRSLIHRKFLLHLVGSEMFVIYKVRTIPLRWSLFIWLLRPT